VTLEHPRQTTRRLAAYHEAGHAVASFFLPGAGPTTRVTIRKQDLGEDDAGAHLSESAPASSSAADSSPDVVRARAIVGLAGIEVDRRLTGNTLTCGSDDDEQVRKLIREAFLDREIQDALAHAQLDGAGPQELDEIVARAVEVVEDDLKRLLDDLRAKARALIETRWPHVEAVAEALLEREVLSGDEARRIIESVD
jgi:cell division protease FtsH